MLSQVVPATGMGIFWNLNGDPYMLLPPYSSTATITNTPQFINTLGLSAVVGQYYYFYAYWPSNNDELGYISLSPRVCDVLLLASRDKNLCAHGVALCFALCLLQCIRHHRLDRVRNLLAEPKQRWLYSHLPALCRQFHARWQACSPTGGWRGGGHHCNNIHLLPKAS